MPRAARWSPIWRSMSSGRCWPGAAGAGLGHQFLRHLQRTRLLLHLVDVAPFDADVDIVSQVRGTIEELRKYDEALFLKPRWLVLNKFDLVAEAQRPQHRDALLRALD